MTDEAAALKVFELRASDFLCLKVVRIRPGGRSIVEVTGLNEAGKTSTIMAIAWALGGRDFALADPIRHGSRRGEVFVDLGQLRVTKIAERKKDEIKISLQIENRDGSQPRSPQTILDDLRGKLLDPIAFLRGKPADRLDVLKGLVKDYNFDETEKQRQKIYDQRTDVNRELKRIVAARDTIDLPRGEAPQKIDVVHLDAQLASANRFNTERQTRMSNRAKVQAQADSQRDEAERLRARARDLDTAADALEARIATASPIPEPQDTAPLLRMIEEASKTNEIVALFAQWEKHDQEISRLTNEQEQLNAQIQAFDDAKRVAIAGARLPYEGLMIGETDIEVAGTPWEQVAFSLRLRISAAMAMTLSPAIKVMLIREYGSLLDKNAMKELTDICVAHDYQCWIETVGEGKPGTVLIEDGEVRGSEP